MEKLIFSPDGETQFEVYVLEKTTIGGVDYYLTTESEDGDCECVILKDLSDKEDSEAVFEEVADENELEAVAKIFESILDDITIDDSEV